MTWSISIYGGMDIHLKSDYYPAAVRVAEALSERWDTSAYITQGDKTVAVCHSGRFTAVLPKGE